MEQKPNKDAQSTQTADTKKPSNLLTEMAKRKAQAQKEGHAFGRFAKGNSRPGDAPKPAFFGGRNGQGKP